MEKVDGFDVVLKGGRTVEGGGGERGEEEVSDLLTAQKRPRCIMKSMNDNSKLCARIGRGQ